MKENLLSVGKPCDVTSNSYDEYNEDFNENKTKFKVGDCVRKSEQKNFFAKRYTQYWSEKVFDVSKIKNTVPWTYVISDKIKNKLIEKVIKRKGDKLYVKWKRYDNSFKHSINKKDLE